MSKAARSSKASALKKQKQKQRQNLAAKLVEKKPYIELITALLTIPFLISVLILNTNTLRNLNATPTPTPETFINGSGFFAAPVGPAKPTPNISQTAVQVACIKSLGPIDISYPKENDTITQNPITITISYDDTEYCGAVWSYRINGGSWSGYDDRSVALYNLPRGEVTFELRVKSIVASEEKTLTRKFIYKGEGTAFPIDNPGSSQSAN